jgi:hypothetical protein
MSKPLLRDGDVLWQQAGVAVGLNCWQWRQDLAQVVTLLLPLIAST